MHDLEQLDGIIKLEEKRTRPRLWTPVEIFEAILLRGRDCN